MSRRQQVGKTPQGRAAEYRSFEDALCRSEARSRAISDLVSDYAYAVRIEPDGGTIAGGTR
jgi:hypothetical protein